MSSAFQYFHKINDLFYSIKKAKLSAYADDKQLHFSHADARTVQNSLNLLQSHVNSFIMILYFL